MTQPLILAQYDALAFLIVSLSMATAVIYFRVSPSMQVGLQRCAESFQGTLQQPPSPPPALLCSPSGISMLRAWFTILATTGLAATSAAAGA